MLTTIRLDVISDNDSVRLKEYLESLEDVKYVVYYEISDKVEKPHYQGYVEFKDKNHYEDSKDRFLDIFRSTHQRSQRSFTPVRKKEEYMVYVAKDKNLFVSKGYTEQEIQEREDASFKKQTKKEKKETRRQEQYARFIKYCLEDETCDMGKYSIKWIGEKLFDFIGYEPIPEQVNWLKGIIFSAQTQLIYKCTKRYSDLEKSAKERWVERIIF